ncbi:WxL domain-containing protein [Enterococcus casseliflavus]|uniref:WxL domain-containing protein n=1 Tax=Enterococcus casseliflavus TaxID=37734 RepID=UPI003D6AA431
MKTNKFMVAGVLLASAVLLNTTTYVEVEATEYTSNGAIEFEPDSSVTNPVDPTDPERPVTPIDPTDPEGPQTGTAGPLSIDFASSFQFGKQLITTETKNYKAELQEFSDGTVGPNYVQVTDKRGTQAGWALSVVQNGQFKTAEDEELEGAELSINFGASASIMSDDIAPEITHSHAFIPNREITLVNAEARKGMGTWVYKFGEDAVEGADAINLNVPGRAVKLAKEYRTTLTWKLSDVPDATFGQEAIDNE